MSGLGSGSGLGLGIGLWWSLQAARRSRAGGRRWRPCCASPLPLAPRAPRATAPAAPRQASARGCAAPPPPSPLRPLARQLALRAAWRRSRRGCPPLGRRRTACAGGRVRLLFGRGHLLRAARLEAFASCCEQATTRLYISVKSRFGLVRVPSMSKITPRSTGRDAVAMLLERDTVARCEERRRTSEERVPNMRSSRVPEGVMDGPLARSASLVASFDWGVRVLSPVHLPQAGFPDRASTFLVSPPFCRTRAVVARARNGVHGSPLRAATISELLSRDCSSGCS